MAPDEVTERLLALGPGQRVTVIGIEPRALAEALRASDTMTRSALVVASGGTGESIADRLLDDLAQVALQLWPAWYGERGLALPGDVSACEAMPAVSRPWLKAAMRRAEAGQAPRFRRVAKALELRQLLLAVDPLGLLLIGAPDPASPARAGHLIDVLEWASAAGAATVTVFAARPLAIPPYDRVLYGALEVPVAEPPVADRFIAPRSRAHHASRREARMEAALQRDPELGPLFSANEVVHVSAAGQPPRVDFLWRDGRVVVELDGPDHQADVKFAADRHRDYELMLARYLVLRLTNGQVDTDLQYAIEKIRAVVALRRSQEGQAP